MKKPMSRKIVSLAVAAAVVFAAYFVFIKVQTKLGQKALAETGLTSLPLDQALAKAKTESKQVLVDVSAIWCPNCRALDKNVFSDSKVKEAIAEKLIFSRLEYESPEGKAFLKKQGAEGFPNLWLLDEKGEVIKHLNIPASPTSFLEQLPS